MRFSIVIPVYNVAAHLVATLDSMRAQSFTDWECLCVDDGSTDASSAILDSYASRDPRFRVFHQKNAGASEARNVALDHVSGEFFLFLDGDDLLIPEALSQLDATLAQTQADGLLTDPVFQEFPTGNMAVVASWRTKLRTRSVFDKGDLKKFVLNSTVQKGFVCGRIYRTSLFASLRFPLQLEMMEDLVFWLDALLVPARWALVDGCCYAYRVHPVSISRVRGRAFYYGILSMPQGSLLPLAKKLSLSVKEWRKLWRFYQGAYAGFLRSLFLQWDSFSDDERTIFAQELGEWKEFFPFQPLPFLTRIRAWCVFHGHGNGAWVDWIERPLTDALNALRRLKRRILR